MATLHLSSALWAAYPNYQAFPDSGQVKNAIGGEVNAGWITNTCAIRLSRTLNYNAVPVPSNLAGLLTVSGGDRKKYALRVRETRAWLLQTLGRPAFDQTKKEGAAFDKSLLATMRGIIGFDIRFADATGHLDLWDGSTFSSEYNMSKDYWTAATRIWLWKAVKN